MNVNNDAEVQLLAIRNVSRVNMTGSDMQEAIRWISDQSMNGIYGHIIMVLA